MTTTEEQTVSGMSRNKAEKSQCGPRLERMVNVGGNFLFSVTGYSISRVERKKKTTISKSLHTTHTHTPVNYFVNRTKNYEGNGSLAH